MNYLSVENISKAFGEKVLFQEVTFGIEKGQKVAFVAKNGSGKSSMLKILAGQDVPDSGLVTFRKSIKVSYLQQFYEFPPEYTILDCIYQSDNPVLKIIKEYNELSVSPDSARYQEFLEQMGSSGGWETEVLLNEMLSKLKLDGLQHNVGKMSGGQKKRIALVKVLIEQPDFLILDEPTNHLDLYMIEWLEDFLGKQAITLLMVTHDRYFLDNVCNQIIELDNQQLFKYKGNYSYFLEKRAARYQVEQTNLTKAKNLLRKELEWMRRQPKARGTKAKHRVNAFDDVKSKAGKKIDESEIELSINMQRLGTKILEFHNVGKSFGELSILRKFEYTFKKGERIGIVGGNGTGKSTFLNMILGDEGLDTGKIVVGETVKFGYYNQNGINVKEDKKVIEVIKDIAEVIPLEKGKKITAAQMLERFLFPPSMHYVFVRKLSGGEKRRLYLLTVLMNNPNFLILDEPTNDLDIFTLNALENYLKIFHGCLIVVSHDRFFMDKLVDQMFVFEGAGNVKVLAGNYQVYREHKKEQQRTLKSATKKEKIEAAPKEKKKKLTYAEKIEFEGLDAEIMNLEGKRDDCSKKMSEVKTNEEAMLLSAELNDLVKAIEAKTSRWMELAELLE